MKNEDVTENAVDGRRVKADRRVKDSPLLPTRRERRVSAERRLPLVDDLNVSFSEWVRFMVLFLKRVRRRAEAKAGVRPTPTKW